MLSSTKWSNTIKRNSVKCMTIWHSTLQNCSNMRECIQFPIDACKAAVTFTTRLGWVKFRECPNLLCGKKSSLNIKGIAHRIYVRSAMPYGSETWSLGQREIGILQRTERAMMRSMCEVKLVDKKLTKDLMHMLNLNETIDQLA